MSGLPAVPPRRTSSPTKSNKQQLTPLQTLLQMGFPKHRAEKALAATGHKGAQQATEWLLAHVNDPLLDDNSPREYILYACPTGAFLQKLQNFWDKSKTMCGWNGCHNYSPHITLVSFFKVPDEDSLQLTQGLHKVMERQGAKLNEPLKLETYTSPSFMGFFVAEEHADYLKRIAMQFVKEVSNAIISDTYEQFDALTACFPWCTTTTARCIPKGSRSISLDPNVKSLHLSLAYQFPNTHYMTLKSLVEEIDADMSGSWELRLYSRDPRVNGKQVHKAIRGYSAIEADELDLRVGDCLYINGEALANTSDGWVEGTSAQTGQCGLLPSSYVERTCEMDAWTLHACISLDEDPLNNKRAPFSIGDSFSSSRCKQQQVHRQSSMASTCTANAPLAEPERLSRPPSRDYENLMDLKIAADQCSSSLEIGGISSDGGGGGVRNLFLMRHGERVDFVFGSWALHCFDQSGEYVRKDLNMPEKVPRREMGAEGFLLDSPLTNIGLHEALLVGEGLLANGLRVDHVYSSPSLRCVQTADAVLRGLGVKQHVLVRVEPGLFEWTGWYQDAAAGQPDWMEAQELQQAGYHVDRAYRPHVHHQHLKDTTETCEEYYRRKANVCKGILEDNPSGSILIVGHSSTLETCSYELLGRSPRQPEEMMKLLRKIPYCALTHLTCDPDTGGKWTVVQTHAPPLSVTHSTNQTFDTKILQNYTD
ncbi:unnamed protein product [Acanthoscelides obtectus]|uniref:Ecdysteroid-phosphate phosphatase n=1 Tax=Acanthoscelides obtectus TaxID=200917 RepID=A0A9P0PEQ5_ACAOB|nr:unnamed protein product [Acanthoscelides obtectus]CAK1665281.1 Protein UBASH3A homolog [Acanthoscelides obtectus]